MEKKILFAHILAILCGLIWGSTFIVSKELTGFMSPIQIMCFRLLLASIIFWLVRPVWSFDKRLEPIIFIMSLFGCTFYFYLETTALTLTYSSNVSILTSTTALMSLILMWVLKKEKVRKKHIIGFVMAFLGIVMIISNGVALHLEPLGDCLALITALSWAIYGLFILKYGGKLDTVILARKLVVYSFFTFMVLAAIEGRPLDVEKFSFSGIGGILFLGLLGSCFCEIVWVHCVKTLGVITSNVYHYLMPIVTLILAAVILHENITLLAVFGVALTVLGMTISNFEWKKPSDTAVPDE